MPLPELVVRMWREMDAAFTNVAPQPWGAVITDPRFPAIRDVNYARLDPGPERPTVAAIEHALLPALDEVGADVMHVVSFDPEGDRGLLVTLSSRGHRLSFDAVMVGVRPPPPPAIPVTELAPTPDLWRWVSASLDLFGATEASERSQLTSIERDVMAPAGKRWFAVMDGSEPAALAALLVVGGVGYLDNVATFPRWRGRGYASALAARLTHEAADAGAEDVCLVADPRSRAVIRMYERAGYRDVGRLAATRGPPPGRSQEAGGS